MIIMVFFVTFFYAYDDVFVDGDSFLDGERVFT